MLVCPRCGAHTSTTDDRCDRCGALLEASRPIEQPTFATETSAARAAKISSGPLAEGQSIGRRYRIVRLLGAGGMGAVYEAWDSEVGIPVALKVIRSEPSADPSSTREREARFKRELLLARRVTHKNVVRIHDIGEVDGLKYITMTFVDGVTLDALIDRERRLSVEKALSIARQVAAGLAGAHEAGVVHRDLKPANIMVDRSNHAWIMDFGIARSTQSTPTPVDEDAATISRGVDERQRPSTDGYGQTVPGQVIGTYQFMAPEQARGQSVDERADVYAFGVILREMLLGKDTTRKPVTSLTELIRELERPPETLRSKNPDVPEPIDAIVRRCLSPEKESRYASAGEVLAELDRLDESGHRLPQKKLWKPLSVVATLCLALGLGVSYWMRGPAQPEAPPEPVSILIADVQNRTGDPIFDGALGQALVLSLEEAPFVTIFARDEALDVARSINQERTVLDANVARLVSRREGIGLVLVLSIDAVDTGYALSVRGFDPAGETEAESEVVERKAYARGKSEVLSAVSKLSLDVREALGEIEPPKHAETFTAASLEAMNAYARAQSLNYEGKPEEALEAYEEAVRLDPDMGRAYNGMAAIYRDLGRLEESEQNFQKALANIDRMTEREKLRTLGLYYLAVTRDIPKAIENYETLVRLYPADNTAHANLALASLYAGDLARAVEEGRAAIDIYPKNVLQRVNYAMYSMYVGDFDTAVEEASLALQQSPGYDYAQQALSLATAGNLDIGSARDAYKALATMSEFGAEVGELGLADLDLYHGRYSVAVDSLKATLQTDRAGDDDWFVAQKLVLNAEALLGAGKPSDAIEAARAASKLESHESILFPAARVLISLGKPNDVETMVRQLDTELQPQPRSYADLIRGDRARAEDRFADAIAALRSGLARYDSWWARFLLGVTYAEAERPVEARSELELCLKRRGEVASVFFVDTPTIRYLPEVYYWLARAEEAMGSGQAARTHYETYVQIRAEATPPDKQIADARTRLSALAGEP